MAPRASSPGSGHPRGPMRCSRVDSKWSLWGGEGGSQSGTSKFTASDHPLSLHEWATISLKDLPGGPQHQGPGLRSFIHQRTHRTNPPPPHRDSGARDSSDRSSRRSHIDWHCLAARAPGAPASGASSAESSGARGGHQGRRARGLPSARMSAGAGGSSSPSGGGGAPTRPEPRIRRPARPRRASLCPSLFTHLPGKPARLGLAGGSARGRPRPPLRRRGARREQPGARRRRRRRLAPAPPPPPPPSPRSLHLPWVWPVAGAQKSLRGGGRRGSCFSSLGCTVSVRLPAPR